MNGTGAAGDDFVVLETGGVSSEQQPQSQRDETVGVGVGPSVDGLIGIDGGQDQRDCNVGIGNTTQSQGENVHQQQCNEGNSEAVEVGGQPTPTVDENPSISCHPKAEENQTEHDESPAQVIDREYAEKVSVALESLETMRKLNLELDFSSVSAEPLPAHLAVDHCRCTHCQRESWQNYINNPLLAEAPRVTVGNVQLDGSRMRRLRGNVGNFFKNKLEGNSGEPKDVIKSESEADLNAPQSARRNILRKNPEPCLTCGHPTCGKHSSKAFKGHIHICQNCAYLFDLNFLVDVITQTASNPEQCQAKVDGLVDCYDRAKLSLEFIAQFADEVANSLESKATRANKIGVGSSATGIASGVAGVVGCGALLFPPVAVAGVPLLIGSLVLGGGATAVQTGDSAARYFSQPNKFADKMVALHGMVLSLLRITEVLSHGLLQNINVTFSVDGFGVDADEESTKRAELRQEIDALLEKHGVTTTKSVGVLKQAVTGGVLASEVATAAGTVGVAAAETGTAASTISSVASVGRSTRYFGRVGTTASASARFIPIAGGLLSAASVFYESKELKRTLQRMEEGSPCEKAQQVRSIRDDLVMLPESDVISGECRRLFALASAERERFESPKYEAERKLLNKCDVPFEEAKQEDISDIISVMETAAKIDTMQSK